MPVYNVVHDTSIGTSASARVSKGEPRQNPV